MIWGILLVIVVLAVTLGLDRIIGSDKSASSIDSDSGFAYDSCLHDGDGSDGGGDD